MQTDSSWKEPRYTSSRSWWDFTKNLWVQRLRQFILKKTVGSLQLCWGKEGSSELAIRTNVKYLCPVILTCLSNRYVISAKFIHLSWKKITIAGRNNRMWSNNNISLGLKPLLDKLQTMKGNIKLILLIIWQGQR